MIVMNVRCDLCSKDGEIKGRRGIDFEQAPAGWETVGQVGEQVHICPDCLGKPISEMLEARKRNSPTEILSRRSVKLHMGPSTENMSGPST